MKRSEDDYYRKLGQDAAGKDGREFLVGWPEVLPAILQRTAFVHG